VKLNYIIVNLQELLLVKIAEETKEAGMTEEEIDDLNTVAGQMNQFLSIIPDLATQLGVSSKEDLLYHTQVRLEMKMILS
jgi:hypothetical protein